MPSLHQLGWSSFFQDQVSEEWAALHIARVVEVQRRLSRVSGEFDGWAEVSGRVRHHASSAAEYPAIGDWVGVAAAPGAERGMIVRRLERRSVISRRAAGRAVDEQVLAANIDIVFVVTAFTPGPQSPPARALPDDDLGIRCGAGSGPQQGGPVRLPQRRPGLGARGWAPPDSGLGRTALTHRAAQMIRERLPFVDVVTVSALDPDGMASLRPVSPASDHHRAAGILRRRQVDDGQRPARPQPATGGGGARRRRQGPAHDDRATADRIAGRCATD